MAQVASLFSDPVQAEQAVNALVEAALGHTDIQVVDHLSEEPPQPQALPAANTTGGGTPGIGLPVTAVPFALDMSDQEMEFFLRGVQQGGVLVIVDLPDGNATTQAQAILQEFGGRVAVK